MANEAFIYRQSTSLTAGTVQITDLKPNTSRRSLTYDKVPQSGYLAARRAAPTVVATVASGGNDITSAKYTGLSAYLLANVEKGGLAAGTSALLDAEAKSAADAIVAIADAGNPMTLTAVNAAIAGVAGNSELTNAGGSASTGSLAAVLKILCGAVYTLPAGSVTETPTGTFNPSVVGAITEDAYRQLYVSGSLSMSVSEGDLATYIADGYCTVYSTDGSVLS